MSSIPPSSVYLRASAHLPAVLFPLGHDPEDYTVTTHYDIVGGDDAQVLGQLEAQHVKFGAALNEGESLFDVADSHSQDLCDIFELMFNPETGWHADMFVKVMGEAASAVDICYIPSDDIVEQDWGRKALHLFCAHIGGAVGHVVVGVSGLMQPACPQEHAGALARVAALTHLGFVHYPGSPYLFLNTELRQVPFDDAEASLQAGPAR
jgi:hypothetical protein